MPPKKAPPGKPVGAKAAMIANLKAKMEAQKAEEERLKREQEEEERLLREEERLAEEQRKFEEEEKRQERERQKEEAKLAKKDVKRSGANEALERMRAAGMVVPDVEKVREEVKNLQAQAKKAPPKPAPKPKHQDPVATEEPAESDTDDEIPEDWEAAMAKEERAAERQRKKDEAVAKRLADEKAAEEAEHVLVEVSKLRSPICCVLGHVDTGKTSLLDRIRSTNVQGGEAGGITQQIGATFFPREALVDATFEINKKYQHNLDIPGLLVIDTPGHESFTNLRSRGSSLCDIAVLVVDIMHGLEAQTKESIRLLREKKCPFIVALNKVDRLYDWQSHENMDIEQTLSLQKSYVQSEFETRVGNILTEFAGEGLNAELYWKNKDIKRFVSIVPTSAHTGEGACDLLLLKIKLVQQFMEGKVTFKDDLQCTLLEVKPIDGIGFTIDVILINGTLNEGDDICVSGVNGPIFTQIRALLTPQPLREMRVRGDYVHHKTMRAAMGIKIAANDLEQAIPGTQLLVVKKGADRDAIAKEVMKDASNVFADVDKSGIGVTVQSSTLGSLEALLAFLKDMKIPVAHVAIGPMYKRHMLPAVAMKGKDPAHARYAVVLAFDTVIKPEAQDLADQHGVEIFQARIIYHLFDMFKKYHEEFDEREKQKARAIAVFPVRLKILQAIRQADPIILGVHILHGQLHPGTPLAYTLAGSKPVLIGKVESIQKDEKEVKVGKSGMDVAVKITSSDTGKVFGRHFTEANDLVSVITRQSIDAIKLLKSEMTAEDTKLLSALMPLFDIRKRGPAAGSATAAAEAADAAAAEE